ncbi:hypothetical protein [Methylomagnum sp.]
MAVRGVKPQAALNTNSVEVAECEAKIAHLERENAEKDQQIYSLGAEINRLRTFQYNQVQLNQALDFLQRVIDGENDKDIKMEAIKQWSIIVDKLFISAPIPIESK